MKKIYSLLAVALILGACSSTKNGKSITDLGIDSNSNYSLADTQANKKALEDIIVFDQEGVTIRREGNNLILSMPELILFDFNKYDIKSGIKPSLSVLAKALGENNDINIKIDGYTDFIGSEGYNLELSVKRARAIKEYLISKGAIGENISIEGYGEQNPTANNNTAEGRARNRRVEFIISRG